MKLGIMQPYYFPYIGYWQLINAVDRYVIYDDVNYITRGWINRNYILMNGEKKLINLQMLNPSQNKLINETRIAGDAIYNKKLLKTIETCYKKAPYYEEVFPVVERVINNPETNLSKYLEFSLRQICEFLSIDTEIIVSSTIDKNNDLKGQEKIIEICKKLGADEYINAIGGQELYSLEKFNSQGIQIKFLRTQEIQYKQFKYDYVPNLSIIDIMMFNSKEDIELILRQCDFI